MTVSAKSKVCGILANPVEHSMSPVIQNFYAEQAGVDMVYIPLKTGEEGLEAAICGAYAMNFWGMNVTVPHKQRVMQYLAEVDPSAREIGAVNTLVRTKDGYKGYNTDALGLLRSIQEQDINLKGSKCILLGAGGAARAAAYVLVSQGAAQVYLLNRSADKAEEFAETVNESAGRQVIVPLPIADYGKIPAGSYLAIQTTSVGMHPDTDQIPVRDQDFYKQIHTGIDVIYTPMETRFMRQIRDLGGKAVNGLDMLVYQGVAAFELWFPHISLDAETISRARQSILHHLGGTAHE